MENQLRKVYLGYEDESISETDQLLINCTLNKIGGVPDWPPNQHVQFPSKCPLCGLHRLLLLQCYVPFENSTYHRTLYIFACINPNCWNQSESWACIRSQFEDQSTTAQSTISVAMPTVDHSQSSWCNGADEWDENDNGDTANGNFMNVDNAPGPNNIHRNSDEDDESNSIEIDTIEQAMGNLQVFDAHNANMSPVQGAVGAVGLPVAVAELEGGDEPGLVTVDSPIAPNKDIQALLYQTAELPSDLRSRLQMGPLQFLPKFLYVEEEWQVQAHDDDKINELINKYKKENAELEICGSCGGERAGAGALEDESYEDVAPLHGDKMFHAFLTRLRKSPRQVLRYSRGGAPLLGAPLMMAGPRVCPRCGSHLVYELQLVPAFSETLRFPPNIQLPYLHFLSVLVFTCAQSCWQPGDTFVQETILFQPEVV